MKRTAIFLPIVVATLLASCSDAPKQETGAEAPKTDTAAAVAEKPATPPPPPMDSAAVTKKYMDYATPGEMHKMLASTDGKWNAETTMWMDEKGGPGQKSTGSMDNKMVLGGRYQQMTFKGTMMGMPFEGLGMLGYDNERKIFVNSWQDNTSTGIMYMEGPYDAATKTITLKGKWNDPVKGELEMKQTLKFIDDKNMLMEMYCSGGGSKEFKSMEMKFARK